MVRVSGLPSVASGITKIFLFFLCFYCSVDSFNDLGQSQVNLETKLWCFSKHWVYRLHFNSHCSSVSLLSWIAYMWLEINALVDFRDFSMQKMIPFSNRLDLMDMWVFNWINSFKSLIRTQKFHFWDQAYLPFPAPIVIVFSFCCFTFAVYACYHIYAILQHFDLVLQSSVRKVALQSGKVRNLDQLQVSF